MNIQHPRAKKTSKDSVIKSSKDEIGRNHMRVHNGVRPFQCGRCPKRFTTKSGHTVHEKLHGGKRFKCKICVKKFSSKVKLKEHLETHLKAHYTESKCSAFFTTEQRRRLGGAAAQMHPVKYFAGAQPPVRYE